MDRKPVSIAEKEARIAGLFKEHLDLCSRFRSERSEDGRREIRRQMDRCAAEGEKLYAGLPQEAPDEPPKRERIVYLVASQQSLFEKSPEDVTHERARKR